MIIQTRLIANSLRDLGYTADITAFVGSPDEPFDLYQQYPWSKGLIHWHWVDRHVFAKWQDTRNPHIATMTERFFPPFHTSHLLFLDADVLPIARFDELFDTPGISAVLAHNPPFDRAHWDHLFATTHTTSKFDYQLSGFGISHLEPHSPPYFNTGVVFATAESLEKAAKSHRNALNHVFSSLNSYFFDQIAFTLTLLQTQIPFQVLLLRYNFPNDGGFEGKFPDELANIRFLHYLRDGITHRINDFQSYEAVHALVCRTDLHGSHECLRQRLAQIIDM